MTDGCDSWEDEPGGDAFYTSAPQAHQAEAATEFDLETYDGLLLPGCSEEEAAEALQDEVIDDCIANFAKGKGKGKKGQGKGKA